MTLHKPTILYYDHGNSEKRAAVEKALLPLGIALVPVTPPQFLQTVGYLAGVKGFPSRKLSPMEILPEISQELMVMCNFKEETLDMLLGAMKSGMVPRVCLKSYAHRSELFLDLCPALSGIIRRTPAFLWK